MHISNSSGKVHYNRIKGFLPPDGEVRLITVTDKQFGRMESFWGKMRKPAPPARIILIRAVRKPSLRKGLRTA